MRSITQALRAAKTDPRVTGVLLRPIQAPSLWGKVQELRDALIDFKSSGKPLVAFLEFAGDREYVLASAASRVVLVPPGQLNLTGLASYQLFLRGTFDKLGVLPDLLHIGDYKTAVNTFTEKGFTPAHREMTESLNHDAFEQLIEAIATARKKSVDDVRALVDLGPMLPEAALRTGSSTTSRTSTRWARPAGSAIASRNCRSSSTCRSCRPRGPASQCAAGRRHLRHRDDRVGQRRDGRHRHRSRLGQAHRVHPRRAQRRQHQGGRAAGRQPWRIDHRLRRDLARADAAARAQAARRVDVGPRRVWWVLHRHAGPRDRGAAGHADRVDRHLLGQVRHWRHATASWG